MSRIRIADVRKFLVAAVGAAGEAVSLGLLHGSAERWTTIGIGVATALLTYVVPNTPTPAAPTTPTAPAK